MIPIFKCDDETDPNNYRPITPLSIFNRIFEKRMYNRLTSFIEENELLYEAQCGFREKSSTQNAILDIVNSIQIDKTRQLYYIFAHNTVITDLAPQVAKANRGGPGKIKINDIC